MKSVSIGAFGSLTLTRRTATVTISAPDASTAAAFCAKSLYLPVPTISRERKVRPATVQVSSSIAATWSPPPTKCTISRSSPSSTITCASVERGTTSRLRSTATFSGIRPSSVASCARVSPAATRLCSPLTVMETVPSVWGMMAGAIRSG